MKLEEIQPPHCYARAQKLWSDVRLIRTEMGRTEDSRAIPEITNAQPREVFFEALAIWHKADRLATELGVGPSRQVPTCPSPLELVPGHCLGVIDSALETLDLVKARLGITEASREPAHEPIRTPGDVLVTLIRVGRDLSRALERPFTPTDVYRVVALASAYAARLGATPPSAGFERGRKPADCYVQLERCLSLVNAAISKRGKPALAERGAPTDVQPGDVYDMANLVLGELAYLCAVAEKAGVPAYQPAPGGQFLPSHVHQLARALEVQLVSL
jgi:hypothetical protein